MSAAGQLPLPTPPPLAMRASLCELLAAVARLPLEAKQETEITLQTLCSTFSRGVYVTRKSSEVGLAYLLARCFSCHPFYAIFLGYSGHLVTLASPGPFMAISKVKYELRLLAKSAQQAGNRKLGLLPAGYFKTHAHTLAER